MELTPIVVFSGGSRISRRGAWTSGGGRGLPRKVSKILYVKTKESGPLGGRAPGTPPSRSANGFVRVFKAVWNINYPFYQLQLHM